MKKITGIVLLIVGLVAGFFLGKAQEQKVLATQYEFIDKSDPVSLATLASLDAMASGPEYDKKLFQVAKIANLLVSGSYFMNEDFASKVTNPDLKKFLEEEGKHKVEFKAKAMALSEKYPELRYNP